MAGESYSLSQLTLFGSSCTIMLVVLIGAIFFVTMKLKKQQRQQFIENNENAIEMRNMAFSGPDPEGFYEVVL